MAGTHLRSSERIGTIGPASNFWLYSSLKGFDLTHPETARSAALQPRLTLQTTSQPITIHPPSTALVVIDMQNFFLSPAIGRSPTSLGLQAQSQLLRHAIPAAHKAGIRIVYLNWGLTDEDLKSMPPATVKAFGWHSKLSPLSSTTAEADNVELENNGKSSRQYVGLGHDLGTITDPDDSSNIIDAGRLLFRSTWNASLTPALQSTISTSHPPDVIIDKNRLSGLWGGSENTPCGRFLCEQNVRTLLFAGVNTDQCVSATLTDAFTLGYDCILLRDGSATSTGETAQRLVEKNCEGLYGFVSTCEWLAEGVEKLSNPSEGVPDDQIGK